MRNSISRFWKSLPPRSGNHRGAAHYLLGANEYLGRALRTRARRWLRRWITADGLVDPEPAALAALGRHSLPRVRIRLRREHFVECPVPF